MITGISVAATDLTKADEILAYCPYIKHLQVKLPAEITEKLHLQQNISKIRNNHPDVEISLHAWAHINLADQTPQLRVYCVELAKEALRLAKQVNARFVVYHAGYAQGKNAVTVRTRARNALAASTEELCQTADELGVAVQLENIYPAPLRSELIRMLDRVEDYDFMLAAVESPMLGYCFDYGHAAIDDRGEPILQRLAYCPASVHLHENDGVNDLHLPPTLADWHGKLRQLYTHGYKGAVIAETKLQDLPFAAEQINIAITDIMQEQL